MVLSAAKCIAPISCSMSGRFLRSQNTTKLKPNNPSPAPFPMNPSHMIFHVVHPTENPAALLTVGTLPLALNARVMLGLVPCAVLLGREAPRGTDAAPASVVHVSRRGLRTPVDTAEEMLAVPVVVLTEVAAAREHGARRAARICASPGLWRSWS